MTSFDSILGILIRDFTSVWKDAKAAGFSSDLFDNARSKVIALKIEEMERKGIPIDLVNMCTSLPSEYTGMLIDLTNNAPVEINFEYLISQEVTWKKLKEIALEFSRLSQTIMKSNSLEPYEPHVSNLKALVTKAEALYQESNSIHDMPSMVESSLDRIRDRIEDSILGKKRGYLTGIKPLDQNLAGLVAGRVYVVAARTSVGKTTFSAFLALQAMKQGASPLFFTNEMDREDLVEKWISHEGDLSNQALQTGELTEDQLNRLAVACKKLTDMRGFADEKSGWNLDQLISVAHRANKKSGVDLIIVDYLQQVRVKGSTTKQEQVSKASDELKKLARDLNVPVIVLAQINRESEKSGKPMMPTLANLKDSGSIEQDADVVMILHKEDIAHENVELMVAKNRYGRTGVINLKHKYRTNSYVEDDSND
jgi:replicative DNA helicase